MPEKKGKRRKVVNKCTICFSKSCLSLSKSCLLLSNSLVEEAYPVG